MNQQEPARIQVLNSVLEYRLPMAQAAEIMGVSERHTKRLLAAYRKDGPAALAHGNRGRRPPNAVPETAAAAVVKLASNGYAGMSMAEACWATGVSRASINVRLSVQHKCHCVMLPLYQSLRRREPAGNAALGDRRHPCIS